MSKAHSKEKCRDDMLHHIRHMVLYWNGLKDHTEREKLEGLAFSILTMIDGCTDSTPAIDLVLRPHPDDKQYYIDQDDDYYEDGMAINDDITLHDLFVEMMKA